MHVSTTIKVTYNERKGSKAFKEYRLNEAESSPELFRISEDDGKYFLSIKNNNKWTQSKMHTTEHFDFYGVSVPFNGAEILLVVHYKPSFSMIEVRVWKGVSVEHGDMAELNELINLIIYQF